MPRRGQGNQAPARHRGRVNTRGLPRCSQQDDNSVFTVLKSWRNSRLGKELRRSACTSKCQPLALSTHLEAMTGLAAGRRVAGLTGLAAGRHRCRTQRADGASHSSPGDPSVHNLRTQQESNASGQCRSRMIAGTTVTMCNNDVGSTRQLGGSGRSPDAHEDAGSTKHEGDTAQTHSA